jgi:hypothetical protein
MVGNEWPQLFINVMVHGACMEVHGMDYGGSWIMVRTILCTYILSVYST